MKALSTQLFYNLYLKNNRSFKKQNDRMKARRAIFDKLKLMLVMRKSNQRAMPNILSTPWLQAYTKSISKGKSAFSISVINLQLRLDQPRIYHSYVTI